jgi:hypothetical protein
LDVIRFVRRFALGSSEPDHENTDEGKAFPHLKAAVDDYEES